MPTVVTHVRFDHSTVHSGHYNGPVLQKLLLIDFLDLMQTLQICQCRSVSALGTHLRHLLNAGLNAARKLKLLVLR